MTTRRNLLQTSLVAGELSEELYGREDVDAYFRGASKIENFFPLPAGGATKRPGFLDLGPAIMSDQNRKSVGFAFIRRRSEWFYVEVSHNRIAVRNPDGAVITMVSGLPYVTAPYTEDDLENLRAFQTGDLLVFTHLDYVYPPLALERFGANDYRLITWLVEDGPFLPSNDTKVTLSSTATRKGQSTTLTAAFQAGYAPGLGETANVFLPGHVGALFEIRSSTTNFSGPAWIADKDYAGGVPFCFSEGNVYQNVGGGSKTGTNRPLHTDGDVSDGVITWRFLHDGAGVVRINQVISATQATGVIERALPQTAPTTYWSEGAFSDVRGWPAVGTVHQERISFFGTKFQPDTCFLSRVGDYNPQRVNFRARTGFDVIADDDALVRTLADGEVNPISFVISHSRLIIGSANGLKRISGPTVDEPITPDQAAVRDASTIGCSNIEPGLIQNAIIYCGRDSERVFEHVLGDQERDPRELTIRARQVGASKIREVVTVETPDKRVYFRREKGDAYALTYDRAEDLVAFAQVTLGGDGIIENLFSAPSADENDDLLAFVKLPSGDRRLWRLARRFRADRDMPEDQHYLDFYRVLTTWNSDQNLKIIAGAGVIDQIVSVSGPAGWLNGRQSGNEIWFREENCTAKHPETCRIRRLSIGAISGDIAQARYIGGVSETTPDGVFPTWRWALPNKAFSIASLPQGPYRVLADGKDRGVIELAAGHIDFDDEYVGHVVLGYDYPAIIQSMPLVIQTGLGSSRGDRMLVENFKLQVRDTVGGFIRLLNDTGDKTQRLAIRKSAFDLGLGIGEPPRAQLVTQPARSFWADDSRIEIDATGPYAFTLVSLGVGLTVNEK